MTPWDKKLQQFEQLLEQRLSDHKANVYIVRANLRKHAEDASAVQVRMLLEYALCNPELANVPVSSYETEFTTIFDIIKKNMINLLVSFGAQYLEDYDE